MKKVFILAIALVASFHIVNGFAEKNHFLELIERPEERLSEQSKISVMVRLPEGHEYSREAPFTFELIKRGPEKVVLQKGILKNPDQELPLSFNLGEALKGKSILEINLEVPYCSAVSPKFCKFKSIQYLQPVSIEAGGKMGLDLEAKI